MRTTALVLAALVLAAAPATARPRTEADVATANQAALARAVRSKRLATVTLTELRREPDDGRVATAVVADDHVELVVPTAAVDGLLFAASPDGTIVHVVPRPRITATVRGFVCHAGPAQAPAPPGFTRVHLALPAGHRYGGDLVVRYPARRFVGQNTCR